MIEGSRVRLTVVGVAVMLLFSALFARLWFLQVAEGRNFSAAATSNRVRVIYEPALRGQILDRNGKPLVQNQPTDVLTFDRTKTLAPKERRLVMGRLSAQLGLGVKDVEKRIDDPTISPYAPAQVATGVSPQVRTYVEEHHPEFPGVDVQRIAVRHYPNGPLAAHLLGYVGEINSQELKANAGQGYRKGDLIGKSGVEQMFESVLRGTPRRLKVEVDSRGRVVRTIEDRKAIPGKDVQLTIDLDAQRLAEESLAQGMGNARNLSDRVSGRYKASGGAVVVLDPNDGSLIAMASAPTFDPNELISGVSADKFKQLSDPNQGDRLLNRAISGQYAPGSTFKLLTSIAALQQQVLDPNAGFYDQGCLKLSDGTQRCNAGKQAHGTVNLQSALTVSSDVYFYDVGRNIWQYYNTWRQANDNHSNPSADDIKKGYAIQDTARTYGFGKPTGIGLAGEAQGRVPDQAWKADFNRNEPDPQKKREQSLWLPGDSVSLAVGQGDLLVTPLQLASAYAAFANGGTLFAPRVAKAVLEPSTGLDQAQKPVRDLPPQPQGNTGLTPEVHDQIMAGLQGAVDNGQGTAHAAFSGYQDAPVAGKTGTAQNNGRQDDSLFVGITPVDHPQYVVMSLVEQGGFGASVSAPIVRRIIEALYGNLNPAPVHVAAPNIQD